MCIRDSLSGFAPLPYIHFFVRLTSEIFMETVSKLKLVKYYFHSHFDCCFILTHSLLFNSLIISRPAHIVRVPGFLALMDLRSSEVRRQHNFSQWLSVSLCMATCLMIGWSHLEAFSSSRTWREGILKRDFHIMKSGTHVRSYA